MLFSTPKKKTEMIDRRQSLKGIPMMNESVTVTPREDGNLTVVVEMDRGNGWFARFMPPVIKRTYKLDELGSYVLRRVDGCRTAKRMVDDFAQTHKVNRREAELCVVQFLKSLAQRQVISIVIR